MWRHSGLVGFVLLLVSLIGAVSTEADEIDVAKGCKDNPSLVGQCSAVHGRIRVYNGTPGVRIWIVGTKRLLGVLPSEQEIMPRELAKQIAPETDVFGDFLVCPFTKEKEGQMQMVCIESASNLKIEKHRQSK